ncbi:SLC13 family permease [Tissierella creatinophila]|uniref:Inner membrane protein YbhI n=1 Tax=Tissierella creatinophila DSM 6911 TaxID=1123403 RepID=A0A1U7M3L6_TISCR|nr:SLC13 family permease [Tissierella creatinophila]OLS01907.1 inner membrane protein YbhI [Tissierella creatinophila DSM 6911]
MSKKKINLIGFILFFILGVFIGLLRPFQPELSSQGNFILMMLIITIGLWIFKPREIPFSISSGLFMASLLALKVPANIVFAGFSGNAVWTLISALFFGFVLAKTGLGKRIAYFGIKNTRLSYAGLLTMWAIIGVVLSILTPSITVRVVIVIPIALNCVNICKLPKGSKGRSLVLLTAWAMALIPGTGWLTGSLVGPILSGFFASTPGLGAIEFSDWAKVSLLPMTIISFLTVVGGYIVLRPSEPLNLSRDVFIEEYKKLGAMSNEEKITVAILVGTFTMFVTNSWHGIPDAATCLTAWFLLSLAGIIKGNEVSTGINWDLVIFVGTGMGFGAIFEYSGVSKWMSSILVDALKPIAGSPWVFVYVVLILMFIWRFVDIAVFVPTKAIIVAILPQVSEAYGIHPLVWVPLLCIAVNSFFLSYQNMFALVAEANMAGEGWTPKHLAQYGTVYFVASMITMLVAIPYWISIGMFG